MRTIKVHIRLADGVDKTITVKDIKEVSLVNGALEVWAKRKDAQDREISQVVGAFANGHWTYFEEA